MDFPGFMPPRPSSPNSQSRQLLPRALIRIRIVLLNLSFRPEVLFMAGSLSTTLTSLDSVVVIIVMVMALLITPPPTKTSHSNPKSHKHLFFKTQTIFCHNIGRPNPFLVPLAHHRPPHTIKPSSLISRHLCLKRT